MNPEATTTCLKKSEADKIIEITGMHKWFGDLHVLNDVNLSVYKGERIVICGPSGSANRPSSAASTAWRSTRRDGSSSTGSSLPTISRTSRRSGKKWVWYFSISTYFRT